MRRQNHSCDQCRKAKRACDATSLREVTRRGSMADSCRGDVAKNETTASEYRPCSYCVKTNKHCTLNWARSQHQAAQIASAVRSGEPRRTKRPRTVDTSTTTATTAMPQVFPSPPQTLTPASTMHTTSEMGDPAVCAAIPPTTSSVDMAFWGSVHFPTIPTLEDFSAMPSHDQHNFSNNNVEMPTLDFNNNGVAPDSAGLIDVAFNDLPVTTSELVSRPAFHNMTPELSALWGMLPTAQGLDVTCNQAISGLSPPEAFSSINGEDEDATSSSAITDGYAMHRPSFTQQQFPGERRMSSFSVMSPSPSGVEFMMATRANNHSISENLLQIYHDVLEHNLTCWITEETCPYNVLARPAKQQSIKSLANGASSNGHAMSAGIGVGGRRTWSPREIDKPQFGPVWTNRVYSRVIRLDKIAQGSGVMQLTRAQNQASQKALHLVIMAFATQWAQGSQRQRESYAAGLTATNHATSEEFDRNIQRSLWHQARQALQDCADVESYRVVCAELIFGLTQRPWDEFEFAELELTTSTAQYGNGSTPASGVTGFAEARRKREAILSKLSEVINKDGPPIFIERAARKIHALKSKFDNHELGFLGVDSFNEKDVTDSGAKITSEDGQTVGLIFWLAVMFDTISASLTERPVVLADAESQHEAAEYDEMFSEKEVHKASSDYSMSNSGSQSGSALSSKKNNRWRIDLFIQDDPERASQQYYYPCSYEDAARNIARATPVKVIMYRQVLYLQNMLRKPYLNKGEAIEEVVSETLMIYRYFNIKYGAFFRELIKLYATVPSRIRGWFVCILAHWHLGALMLADVLEVIDRNQVGLEEPRKMRLSSRTVASIRRTSANQLADLARVATPLMPDSASDPSMPDFHFAVREGTILTEPWTILLIRAFSKAATIHLREADEIREKSSNDLLGHDGEACRESLRRCEDCIQALWYLGKKSDMARNVAVVLFRAMNVGEH